MVKIEVDIPDWVLPLVQYYAELTETTVEEIGKSGIMDAVECDIGHDDEGYKIGDTYQLLPEHLQPVAKRLVGDE